ncbi:hypothetical protein CT0861_10427, partial [Colletotrichum tofieldiae]
LRPSSSASFIFCVFLILLRHSGPFNDMEVHQLTTKSIVAARQQRPEAMCRHIVKHRRDIFESLAFNECVAVGIFFRKTDFDTLKILETNCDGVKTISSQGVANIKHLAQRAVEKQGKNLWKDCLTFLRNLTAETRPLTLIEAAFYFANRDLTTENNREQLLSSCSKLVAAFTSPSPPPTSLPGAKEDGHVESSQLIAQHVVQPNVGQQGRKRKREPTSGTFVAIQAGVWEVRSFLGTYLYMGFKNCRDRQYEIASANISTTYTLELHFPPQMGEDFKLFVPVSSSIGQTFEEALSGPSENLVDMVNDWLFEALVSSRSYAEGGTRCVRAYLHDNEEDTVLEMAIAFAKGMELSSKMFI